MNFIEIDSVEMFDDAIKHPFVLVDFYAKWCGPCKSMIPKLDQLMVRSEFIRLNLKTYKVDIDELPEIADKYNVKSLPTFICFENGLVFDVVNGANYEQLVKMVDDLVDV
jgi:thioredoxin 1